MENNLKMLKKVNEARSKRSKSINGRIDLLGFLCMWISLGSFSCNQANKTKESDPILTNGAVESLVDRIESAVIIPGDTHKDLWVHPEVVTIPGDPIVVELRARTTDRRGKDQHSLSHYFRTDDFFQTLSAIEEPVAKDWDRIGLSLEDFNPPGNDELQLPESFGHTWASAYLDMGGDTILQAFTTQEKGRYSVQSFLALAEKGKFTPVHISNSWTNDIGRGLYEPQIAAFQGKYYMTVRAEDGRGYLLISHDGGRSWEMPIPWKWDNGEIVDMNQTMTKLLVHSEGLLLVYTRIRDDNDHVFRNRSPLHLADVDPETLSLKRDTERTIVPNKGLAVGNFWVWPIDQHKSYVMTAEWPRDGREENGDIWLTKIRWKNPNKIMTNKGEKAALDRH